MFRSIAFLCGLILTGLAVQAASRAEMPGTGEALIVYSGQTLGEIKPCGCAREEEQGGLERRMTYFTDLLKDAKNALIVDVGDNFKEPTPQGKIKGGFLLKSLARMPYDAVILGEKDLVYGNRFVLDHKEIPWVATNIDFGEKNLQPPRFRIKRLGNGLKTAILGIADPGIFSFARHSGLRIGDPRQAIEEWAARLKVEERPDLIVVLTHMRREDALNLLDVPGIDVIINGHVETADDTIDMQPVRRGGRLFLQPAPKGQKMGELRIDFGLDGKKSYNQRMVKLDSSVKFDPEMVKLYEEYNEAVEDLFMASLAARRNQRGKKVYATGKVCADCHPREHKIWAGSRHARAYETLRRINKAFDPECLVCHTVGFNQPGGFISENDTAELENVQCEMCHGPGLSHARSPQPGFGRQARRACRQCHRGDHSPRFNFTDYWPRIRH